MTQEIIKIEVMEESCYVCEDYSKLNSINPPKIAILSCEGACARGEISRLAANLIAHNLSPKNTVRYVLEQHLQKMQGKEVLSKMQIKQ